MGSFGVVFWVTNIIIIGFGVYLIMSLTSIHKQMKENQIEARNVYNITRGKSAFDLASGSVGYSAEVSLDYEKMDKVREKYNQNFSEYQSKAQLISILPLMGLLGTIFGLIPGLSAVKEQNFLVLYSSLSTALYSTLFGLVFSIILKCLVSSHSKTMSSIEDYFEDNERKYNQVLEIKSIKEANAPAGGQATE
jgi:biopolymer transport protein ExbB/TolQ